MPSLTVKNMPPRLYERLKRSAKANRRSLNGEIIATLEMAAEAPRIKPAEFLARVRKLREEISAPPLTDALLRKAKREGRP